MFAREASAAELQGNPEDACSGDKSQEGQACQIAIDTDAASNRSIQLRPRSFAISDDATSQASMSHSGLKSRARRRQRAQREP